MKSISYSSVFSAILVSIILLIGVYAIYMQILHINGGHFTYTIDDPYIHLRLAQNIWSGHYGLNPNEFSTPSSSIIWPLLLAAVSNYLLAPLIINIIITILSIFVFSLIIDKTLRNEIGIISKAFILLLLVLATNQLGLIFLGMEHSLQVFLTLVTALGVISFYQTGKLEGYFLLALCLAPLVRYENAAISLFVCLFCYFQNKKNSLIFVLGIIALSILAFSMYLKWNSSHFLPNSIIAKMSGHHSFISNFFKSAKNIQGSILILISTVLIYQIVNIPTNKNKLKILLLACIFAHLFFGKYGWFFRYEIYIWAFTIGLGFFLMQDVWQKILTNKFGSSQLSLLIFLAILASSYNYVTAIGLIRKAAHNIYQQQYQMKRFVQDFIKADVAVNDIGLVSYNSPYYVLDLWGLASNEALTMRLNGNDLWLTDVVRKKQIPYVLIYDDWFKVIPKDWISLGKLSFANKKITPSRQVVHFYATSTESFNLAQAPLQRFISSLPLDVTFTKSLSQK